MSRNSRILASGLALATACALARTAHAQPAPDASAPEENPSPPPPELPPGNPDTVVIGTPTMVPGTDQPVVAAKEALRRESAQPWAGSSIYNANSVTTGTIFRGQQLYDNPTVESALYILPRYSLSEAFQIRARVVVSYEYTSSDTTTYRNEPLLSDAAVQLYYRKIPSVWGIQPYVAANMSFPTSKASRARTLVVNPGVTLQLTRNFERVLGGDVAFIVNTSYAHPFYRSETAETPDARPQGSLTCFGGNNCSDTLSGQLNPSDVLSYTLIVVGEWGKWSPAVQYLGASQWVYHPKSVVNPIDGTPVEAPDGFDRASIRQTHYVSAWLDYNFNSWFTGEVGFWNSVAAIDASGRRANLIFDRYQDTRVYVGCSVQLDNLAKVLQGGDEGEAGVVRAKNNRGPIMRF